MFEDIQEAMQHAMQQAMDKKLEELEVRDSVVIGPDDVGSFYELMEEVKEYEGMVRDFVVASWLLDRKYCTEEFLNEKPLIFGYNWERVFEPKVSFHVRAVKEAGDTQGQRFNLLEVDKGTMQ